MNGLNEEFVRLFERLFHDLRSPLNAIIGFSTLVSDGSAGPTTEKQREFLADILTSARELTTIIDNSDRQARALIPAFGSLVDDISQRTG